MKIHVVVKMFQDAIQEVTPFVGPNAKVNAMNDFKAWTGITYSEFLERKQQKEDDDVILGEDWAGSQIYCEDAVTGPEMDTLEVLSMIAVSTAHVTRMAMEFLINQDVKMPLVIYEKNQYGYFIVVPESEELECMQGKLPESLFHVLHYASNKKIDWLMLDSDGLEIPGLKTYEW
ncbi:hypothetical protein [Paenibacillus sp. NPDC093718]|uniref:DUF5983 family protein n=1 Tax=Paenibacillus sp. NPDC093718 TaxID=3390601 RepID=UPI003D05A5E8